MALVKLWTLQFKPVVDQLETRDTYYASWRYTVKNYRIAYEWMMEQLQHQTSVNMDVPPVWCWHSCNGQWGSPPTADTALSLDSRFGEQPGFILELMVPEELTLLSSYYAWNRVLDYVYDHQAIPRSPHRRRWLFQPPLIKHQTDDVQAVIPCLQWNWITQMAALEQLDRSSDQPLI